MRTKPRPPDRAMVSPDGHRVELVLVQKSLRRPPRPMLRVTWRRWHVADCATVEEVARYVELSTLEPRDRPPQGA